VPMAVRRERAGRLRAVGQAAAARFFAGQVGSRIALLTEADGAGHSEHFSPVRLNAPRESGQVIAARVIGAMADHLLAEAA
jgi:threonylcarbamoyladenosine tRNA methylthiotransferase MtaB